MQTTFDGSNAPPGTAVYALSSSCHWGRTHSFAWRVFEPKRKVFWNTATTTSGDRPEQYIVMYWFCWRLMHFQRVSTCWQSCTSWCKYYEGTCSLLLIEESIPRRKRAQALFFSSFTLAHSSKLRRVGESLLRAIGLDWCRIALHSFNCWWPLLHWCRLKVIYCNQNS